MPPLHVGVEICAPGHVHAIGPRVRLHGERLLQRLGLPVGEGRKPEHQRLAAPAAGCRPLPLSTALPSPPSHGGGTRIGSGHAMSGNAVGPNRPASPFFFRRSALNTFSGVIGTSSMRTPTASYTAFATAGGTGSSGPCPHSLAPNGPFGSGSSTTYVTMSHISSVVGLLYSSRLGILWTTLRLPRYAISSISASPRPMYTEPSIWPITVAALIARPTSCAIQILGTRTIPVAGSTSTSATQAL